MKSKTIKAIIAKKMNAWWSSIEDEDLRKRVEASTIVTGGCIASMLLREKVNDFDVYLKDFQVACDLAFYYVKRFKEEHADKNIDDLDVNISEGRIRIGINRKAGPLRGGVKEHYASSNVYQADGIITDPGEIDETLNEAEKAAIEAPEEDKGKPYRPVFLSTNAITLSNRLQIVLRFYGEPEDIHKNYDFVHCTNYWASWTGELTLHPAALESLLSKELRYVGSKYPICSVFRLRKFIARQWTINAGQILKMAMQISSLDLTDMRVLEDQLVGVDVAYFIQVIDALKEKDPEKVNAAYLVEILDRMF